jgi:GT2 family glycosyltransferase
MTHRHYQELPREIDGEIRWVVTCNAALRRTAVEDVGGFDESFPVPGGEDTELCSRLRASGYRLAAAEDAVVLHDHSWRSLRAFYDTWRRYGRGDARALHLRGEPLDVRATVLADVRFCARTVRNGVRDARQGLPVRDAAAFSAMDITRMVSQRSGLYREYRKLERST